MGAFFLFACTSAPKRFTGDPRAYYAQLCPVTRPSVEATGEFAIQIDTSKLHGTFPATVRASSGKLDLEITHIFGGRLVALNLKDGRYSIDVAFRKEKREGQGGLWSGIPMDWAPELFLGIVPCQPLAQVRRFGWEDGGEWLVADNLRYQLDHNDAGKTWVSKMRVDRRDDPNIGWIELEFSEPEQPYGPFRNWQVESGQGRIRVRWSGREFRSL